MDAFHPLALVGQRIIMGAFTVGGSYVCINLFYLFNVRRKVYMTYLILTYAAITFEYNYHKASTRILDTATAIQRYFNQRYQQSSRERQKYGICFKRMPKMLYSYKIFRVWRPEQYLNKILLSCIKIHFSLHSNIPMFKKSR